MRTLKVPKYLHIENRTVRCALCALFCAVVVDGLITEFLVTNGYGSEINPLLTVLVGGSAFLHIKIAGAFLVTLFLWIKYNADPRPVYITTVVALTFYTAIVYWNLSLYFFVLLYQPI
jgi:hypothetical protein